jgi:2,4-dienoyl-CoA reductase-like NADH-dependent reductase (Old Yellow Enzyme family)
MTKLFQPLQFKSGVTMKNRLTLAPLTNTQSNDDGRLSDDEYRWLTMRAKGGFGLTMTCASHVQQIGRGFHGQLGCFSDRHIDGLARLASGIKDAGSLAVLQLHHAGMRSPTELISARPVCPSDHETTGARALTSEEAAQLSEDFVAAAERAEKAGFDGVEIHAAHGYVLCQFLSPTINVRKDAYGGSPENRSRIIFEIVDGIRARCRPDFLLGVRLSPERFDVRMAEIRALAQRLMTKAEIDFIDMSLWDCFKEPEEEEFQGRPLMSYFTELLRGDVRLGVAGKLRTGADIARCIDLGADFATIGRAAILHHDLPERLSADPNFEPAQLPVSADHLRSEGLGEAFIRYMSNWQGFVE